MFRAFRSSHESKVSCPDRWLTRVTRGGEKDVFGSVSEGREFLLVRSGGRRKTRGKGRVRGSWSIPAKVLGRSPEKDWCKGPEGSRGVYFSFEEESLLERFGWRSASGLRRPRGMGTLGAAAPPAGGAAHGRAP